jgi:DNA invertase Pin-like site-specific DNA recombinase
MHVGLYVRVSTHDQHTLLLQQEAMQAYITTRGWTRVMHVFLLHDTLRPESHDFLAHLSQALRHSP